MLNSLDVFFYMAKKAFTFLICKKYIFKYKVT